MSNTHRKMRVFVASPDDVKREREHLEKVVASLNKGLADRRDVFLELKDWRQVAPNMGRAQGVIFDQIPVESWDVMVGVLWSRFGTPSGAVNTANGLAYESGTAEEFSEPAAWVHLGAWRARTELLCASDEELLASYPRAVGKRLGVPPAWLPALAAESPWQTTPVMPPLKELAEGLDAMMS